MHKILIKTYPKLLELAKSEISKIIDNVRLHPYLEGYLEAKVEAIDISTIKLLLFARTYSHVYWKLGEGKVTSKDDLYELTQQATAWHKLWDADKKFAVEPETDGSFTRKEIGTKVGQAIVDSFKSQDKTTDVSLDQPEVKLFAKIANKQLTLAINAPGKPINTKLETLNRALIEASNWEKEQPLGEIYYAGVSDSAYEYGKNVARRDKISGILLPNLQVIDKKKILQFIQKNWETLIPPSIKCFETKQQTKTLQTKRIQQEKISLYSLSELSQNDINIYLSNLVKRKPDREGEREYLQKALDQLSQADFQIAIFLLREDIQLPEEPYKQQTAPSFQGIPTKIVSFK